MLSEMHDKQTKRSTAGIRVDVPEFLRKTEKVLEEYGRRIRAKHRGTKHHVKFDDADSTIYLNLRKFGDATWTRVYENQARQLVAQLRKEDADNIKKKFHGPPEQRDGNAEQKQPAGPSGSRETASGLFTGVGAGVGKRPRKTGWTGTAGSASGVSL